MSKHLRTLESVSQLPVSSTMALSPPGRFSPFDSEVAAGCYLDLSVGGEAVATGLRRRPPQVLLKVFVTYLATLTKLPEEKPSCPDQPGLWWRIRQAAVLLNVDSRRQVSDSGPEDMLVLSTAARQHTVHPLLFLPLAETR